MALLTRGGVPTTSVGRARSRDPFEVVGRLTRLAATTIGSGSDTGGDPARFDRPRGVAVVVAATVVWTAPVVAAVVLALGWWLPKGLEVSRARVAGRALADETLLAVELASVIARTGATVPQTIEAIAPRLGGRLGRGLERAAVAHRAGSLLDDELGSVADDLGAVVADFLAILRAAHVDGDPMEFAFLRLADRMRADNRRAVDGDVRRLSVKLLVPLVCCTLPGFVLIAIVPLGAAAFGGAVSPGR
ncbi:MAG: type II secretion system F family protein [Actinobacteria bacterium]|nr:type II secretion system F family protein [Actinomycetota bacterium]